MKESLYTVSDVASYCGVTARTVRYYDELGLVTPEYVDPGSGYRYYTESQIDKIRFVLILKDMGMQLKECIEFCKDMSAQKYLDLLGLHKKNLEEKIAVMTEQLRRSSRHEEELRLAMTAEPPDGCFLRTFPPLSGYFIPAEGQDRHSIQLELRRIEGMLGSGASQANILRAISRDKILKGDYLSYSGFIVHENPELEGKYEHISYPERKGVVTYCDVARPESGPYWERLMRFIEKNGYKVAGTAIKRILLEKGITADDSGYISMLSIPVE